MDIFYPKAVMGAGPRSWCGGMEGRGPPYPPRGPSATATYSRSARAVDVSTWRPWLRLDLPTPWMTTEDDEMDELTLFYPKNKKVCIPFLPSKK